MDDRRRAVVERAMRRALAVREGTAVDMYLEACRYMPKAETTLTYKEALSVLKALHRCGHARFTNEVLEGMAVKKLRIGIYSRPVSEG